MTSQTEFNLKLVQLIEKHKILYDPKVEGYLDFQAQEQIWDTIAKELNEDIHGCKLKWKNIRSCYTRYLRLLARSRGSYRRSYYLAKHLDFLLPIYKSRQYPDSSKNPSNVQSANKSKEAVVETNSVILKTEAIEVDDGAFEGLAESSDHWAEYQENGEGSDSLHWDKLETPPLLLKKRKDEEETQQWDNLENSPKKRYNDDEDPDLNFFKSLLPDVHRMEGKQKSKLKIAILREIDQILYAED